MAITVTFNNQQPWGTYSPYVSMEVVPTYFGQKWVDVTHIVLDGVWPASAGNLDTFRANVLTAFSRPAPLPSTTGGTFEFTGTGGTQTWDNVFIDSVNFPSQGEHNILKYNIILKAYDFPTRNSQYPILDPSDQVTVEQNSNMTRTITHTVSAKGIDIVGTGNTSGVDSAIAWVQSRIALLPANHSELTSYGYVLLEETEDIDQFSQQFTVTRKYITDPHSGTPGSSLISRFSLNVTSTLQGDFDKAVITGEIRGGKGASIASIRTKAATDLAESNLLSIISSRLTYSQTIDPETGSNMGQPELGGPINNFNLQCNDYSLEESEADKSVKVKATFENARYANLGAYKTVDGTEQLHYLDWEVSFDTDMMTGVTKVNVDAQLIVKGGLITRNTQIDRFLKTEDVQYILYDKASDGYGEVIAAGDIWTVNGAFSLNPESTDFQVTKNNKKGTLSMSASFNDERYIQHYTGGSWDVTVKTPVPVLKANPSGLTNTNGYWSIQSMDFCTREKVSANYSIGIREDGDQVLEGDKAENLKTLAKTYVDMLFGYYGNSGGCFPSPEAMNVADGCYPTSKTVTLNETDITTVAHSEERSVHLGRPPLIDINLSKQLTNPVCPSLSSSGNPKENVCGTH